MITSLLVAFFFGALAGTAATIVFALLIASSGRRKR